VVARIGAAAAVEDLMQVKPHCSDPPPPHAAAESECLTVDLPLGHSGLPAPPPLGSESSALLHVGPTGFPLH
jgi:hypothetical protein